jgi:hypothetical protein
LIHRCDPEAEEEWLTHHIAEEDKKYSPYPDEITHFHWFAGVKSEIHRADRLLSSRNVGTVPCAFTWSFAVVDNGIYPERIVAL